MLLENKYYQIIEVKANQTEGKFHLHLLPDCDVYQGHFPGHPICPGVCHIETIKECTMHLTGKRLSIATIKQCRFLSIATPSVCPEVDVIISACPIENGYKVTARITDAARTYVEFKGTMTV